MVQSPKTSVERTKDVIVKSTLQWSGLRTEAKQNYFRQIEELVNFLIL